MTAIPWAPVSITHTQNDTFVVAAGDGAETLLPGRVPYLQLNTGSIDVDGFELEIHANRGQIHIAEGVITKPNQEGGLSYPTISDDDQFEEVLFHINVYIYFYKIN